MDLMQITVEFLMIYFPPMVANGSPVVISKLIKTHPIDFGKNWTDGRRILGDGKSFEGALGGIVAGEIVAVIIGYAAGMIEQLSLTGVIASFGAIAGDIIKSFFKRRLGIERGRSLPIADQLDFYLGATVAVLICGKCLHPSFYTFLFGLLIIPALHIATNKLAYKLGLKNVPW
ncbi:MAG: CDP-2,3-bis-(O-geranylgeranyl)-sn-glycerol synthase [Fervidicoccaceae archaeon]|jgi:CDP-2,3-bis-(O-geranylgeranyl)-sn-glycerol synthase